LDWAVLGPATKPSTSRCGPSRAFTRAQATGEAKLYRWSTKEYLRTGDDQAFATGI
jgi:hypothetical protein